MVSPEALTDGSLNHNHPDNAAIDRSNSNPEDASNSNTRIEGVKQPSYLNLACCISGYTTLTTYNSKQREGFRSRDISPARIGSSLYGADDASNPSLFTSVCGNFLTPQPRYLTPMDHRKKSGDKMWNGNGAADVSSSTFTTGSSTTNSSGNSSFYSCETTTEESSTFSPVTSQNREVPSQASSFILQRVERLYGPGALAQGFYTRRSLNSPSTPQKEAQEEVSKDVGKESALPVLRLLRPEFRAQLSLATRKSNSPVCSPNRSIDSIDSAVERIIPIKIEDREESSDSKTIPKQEENETANVNPVKGGEFYLNLVLKETDRLLQLGARMEEEVSSVPDHIEGRLRAAAGKARLLANQKLAQFKGLCHKNINQDTTEDFPTTCEDLAGFWDMVSIQIDAVHEEFKKIDVLRKAGWPEQDTVDNGVANREIVSNGGNASRRQKSVAPTHLKSSTNKARDEARKKLLAERRKEMRNKINATEDIVIV